MRYRHKNTQEARQINKMGILGAARAAAGTTVNSSIVAACAHRQYFLPDAELLKNDPPML
jgi:hypothetical protein